MVAKFKQKFKIYYQSNTDNRHYRYDGISYDSYDKCYEYLQDIREQFPDIEFSIYIENLL